MSLFLTHVYALDICFLQNVSRRGSRHEANRRCRVALPHARSTVSRVRVQTTCVRRNYTNYLRLPGNENGVRKQIFSSPTSHNYRGNKSQIYLYKLSDHKVFRLGFALQEHALVLRFTRMTTTKLFSTHHQTQATCRQLRKAQLHPRGYSRQDGSATQQQSVQQERGVRARAEKGRVQETAQSLQVRSLNTE